MFHKYCVDGNERVPVRRSTLHIICSLILFDIIRTLYSERDDWWYYFCDRPLIILPEFVRSL